MTPKAEHIAMRQLIRRLAATPGGYAVAHAKGRPGASFSHQHTDRMVKMGELVKVKVKGHYLHFVKTQAMADDLAAALVAGKAKRIRKPDRAKDAPRIPRAGPLRLWIQATSQQPTGVTRADCAHIKGYDGFSKCIQRLVAARLLYRVKVQGWPMRYFAKPADAQAWKQATAPYIAQHKPKAIKPKAEKVAKPRAIKAVKLIRRTAKQQMQVVERKPYHPPVPRKDAEIVWPAHIKPVYRPFVDLRAVSVPYQRIGTASWVTL